MALFILKSSIYNKWFTVYCDVYFPKGSSCLVHPAEKVTNKNSGRLSKDEAMRLVFQLVPKLMMSSTCSSPPPQPKSKLVPLNGI